MRIDLRDLNRQPLGQFSMNEAQGSPPDHLSIEATGATHRLNWETAFDNDGLLRQCPACGCGQLFQRKDFPQHLGLTLVVISAGASLILFGLGNVVAALGILALAVVVDRIVYYVTGRCLVCYRCRSEFRDLTIDTQHHEPWDLAIGEKYRPIRRGVESTPETPDTVKH